MPATDTVTLGVQHSCLSPGPGAELRVTVRSTSRQAGEPEVACIVTGPNGASYDGTFNGLSYTFRFSPVADGEYTLEAYDYAGNQASRTYTITCGQPAPPSPDPSTCDLALSELKTYAPTAPGLGGQMQVRVSTSAATYTASVTRLSDNKTDALAAIYTPGTLELFNVPSGAFRLSVKDAKGCEQSLDFTIDAAPAPPVVVPPVPVPRWFAVGGRLPRPALLSTPVTALHTADGAPRVGLHVVVELFREGQELPFERLRKTVRTEAEQVDIAEALHAQLVPEARYPVGVVTHDAAATLAFRARYREVDQDGEGDWVEEDVTHYALLAALPDAAPTAAYLVGGKPARPFSAFPDGQAVHWVGLPLDVAVWLPVRDPEQAYFAEFLYRDGFGRTLQVVSVELPSTLPPGVTRVPLPKSPPAEAATLTFSLVNPPRDTAPDELPTGSPEVHDYLIPDLNDNDFR